MLSPRSGLVLLSFAVYTTASSSQAGHGGLGAGHWSRSPVGQARRYFARCCDDAAVVLRACQSRRGILPREAARCRFYFTGAYAPAYMRSPWSGLASMFRRNSLCPPQRPLPNKGNYDIKCGSIRQPEVGPWPRHAVALRWRMRFVMATARRGPTAVILFWVWPRHAVALRQ